VREVDNEEHYRLGLETRASPDDLAVSCRGGRAVGYDICSVLLVGGAEPAPPDSSEWVPDRATGTASGRRSIRRAAAPVAPLRLPAVRKLSTFGTPQERGGRSRNIGRCLSSYSSGNQRPPSQRCPRVLGRSSPATSSTQVRRWCRASNRLRTRLHERPGSGTAARRVDHRWVRANLPRCRLGVDPSPARTRRLP
jgi:hypothetical protein